MSAELSSSPTPGPAPAPRRTAWGRELAAFCAMALLVLLAVSAGPVWLSERIRRDNPLEGGQGIAGRVALPLGGPGLARALSRVPGRWGALCRGL